MENKIRISYPNSEKVYIQSKLFPDIKVGMRKISLTPTVTVTNGEKTVKKNAPVYVLRQMLLLIKKVRSMVV